MPDIKRSRCMYFTLLSFTPILYILFTEIIFHYIGCWIDGQEYQNHPPKSMMWNEFGQLHHPTEVAS